MELELPVLSIGLHFVIFDSEMSSQAVTDLERKMITFVSLAGNSKLMSRS